MPQYSHQAFPQDKISIITPVIDPLASKNQPMDKAEAQRYLLSLGLDISQPLVTQVSRFDPWKDPQGVIDAYRTAKKEVSNLQLALVAQMATDDPEGIEVYEQVKKYAGDDPDIHLLVNLPDNDLAVNAFQTASDIIMQKSIREGFGLVVTEAMWKGAVVIGGNVGGIKFQIQDAINGFLVNSSKEATEKIIYILKNLHIARRISQQAHKTVKNNFLLPHKVLNYLNLLNQLLKSPVSLEEPALTSPSLVTPS
ncbi:MAG: Glycosyl transferase group 1 [Candidatus Daviesbacteria bacterium GW2011_GWA1_41_61]|uniref:Glycosyl transferase group 1 n=1 Tax=Candidatus Daviesbacteria bacterium GW2011_GWA2_40_9 TaxID=1618424 RepID=A0A0G0X3W2_9BACT|nr:MAG: Glycosyl transferase group 1 [Candidatus Daviesbacteria bacterium GW2011_GWC1_40_9]KKR82302.1 MAG: Glycosyl transferase group 1 [Candidatus Daviesbacteria bacterium GW2011_GWA2_40_9]KKR93053.1 MAG: Glycosyl transferase group 1 [Candidatus Daviesbacteria bacterium GW2011_GWB1_41_15]KKS15597.1 MAG: Glycosyl transferase group 1 [Candidatus Daviesbacteria bacterium GW2011_GWA1_41_61]